MTAAVSRANSVLLRRLLLVSVGMFGFGFALVPLYDVLCDVTGLNRGEVQALAQNTQVDYSRVVGVEMVASVPDSLPVRLVAPNKALQAHPGELVQMEYEVENLSGRVLVTQAIPSYSPQLAAKYFKKIDCFCFREQVLQPHEKRKLPVMFVLDKETPKDLTWLALSYTMFESPKAAR